MPMDSERDPLRKIPTKHAPEAKADLGSVLKAARIKKGATLEAVGQHTRIPKKFLDALENNRYEEFPALAYLRGFLKSYCDYLEVDFEPLWKQVVPDAPPPTQQPPVRAATPPTPKPAPIQKTVTTDEPTAPPPPPAPKAAPAPAPTLKSSPSLRSGEPAPAPAPAPKPVSKPAAAPAPKPAPKPAPAPHHDGEHHAPAPAHGDAHAPTAPTPAGAAGAIAAVVVLAILIGGWALMPRKAKVEAPPPPVQPPAALQPVKTAVEPALSVVFRRDMWVSISIDGVEKFQGRVPQGSKQEWKAHKQIALRASDPQALKLSLNGQPYTLPQPDSDGTFRIEGP